MSTDPAPTQPAVQESPEPINVTAVAGIVFTILAAILYGVLFFKLKELPSRQDELEGLKTNAPALTRLLMVAAGAGMLNVVSLILCVTGYVVPRGSRLLAVVGSLLALVMLLTVFSVVVASLLFPS